ncbi:MAG: globin [SAR86 cluster bacterium]|mgnify:FL=1|jgi:hemoglobin-like flavoprotein|tara:strand:+ start:5408 stop:5845 length:438 start_codon:yes stop_codon:yes gene_type:complete
MDLELLFEESYDRLVGHGIGITDRGQVFFRRFYEAFSASSDEVALKFSDTETDIDKQVRVLQKAMFHLISFYLLKNTNDFMEGIALSHDQDHLDINPELYDLWLDSLLQTVAEMDVEAQADTELAWKIVMTPGILYLKSHHSPHS